MASYLSESDFERFLHSLRQLLQSNKEKLTTIGRGLSMPPEGFEIFFRLLYGSALNPQEAEKLQKNDFDLKNRLIKLRKNNEFQDATVLPNDVPILEQYLATLESNKPIFSTNRFTTWAYAKKAGKMAGLDVFLEKKAQKVVGLSPRIFRDSRAKQMERDGASSVLIRLKLRKNLDDDIFKYEKLTIDDLLEWERKTYQSKILTNMDLVNHQPTSSNNDNSIFSFEDLKNYLTKEMVMLRNYQPVIIKTLLDSPNLRVSYDDIVEKLKETNNFESKDYRLIAYDVQREVLEKFGRRNLVLKDEETKDFILNIDKNITENQRQDLIQICDEKIKEIENNSKRKIQYWNIVPGGLTNYLLVRHNPDYKRNKTDREYWDDILGKEYHFGKTVPNYTKVTPGTKTVWFYTDNEDIYLWGYGNINNLRTLENGKFVASISDFTRLNELNAVKAQESVQKKIKSLRSWNPFNSIIEINKDIYDEIANFKVDMEETFINTALPLPKSGFASAKDKIKQELLIDDKTIEQIVGSLYSGKNVLLTGPVGTGKTHLAQLLPKYIWEEFGGYYPETVTATSDWTTQDVIGGIFPKVKKDGVSYLVQKGCVSDTISRNWKNGDSSTGKRINPSIDGKKYRGIWLVIDEFNRANIDRAFGQLFTALEYKKLKIPTTNPDKTFEEIMIPEDYRIIGTLNTFDKHFLFRISDALKRRFSFIEILPPSYDKKEEEIRFAAEKAIAGLTDLQKELNINSYGEMHKDQKIIETLDNLYEIMAFVRLSKNLGTALLISMFREVLINFFMNRDWEKSLDNALTTILLPQLESLQYWQIDSIMNFVGGRIHELFRTFDVNRRPDVDRYEEELKNLTKYLRISGKNKKAYDWNTKFRTGEIMRESSLSDLDPWKDKKRPNLRTFRENLEAMKKEKGYFEENNEEAAENAI